MGIRPSYAPLLILASLAEGDKHGYAIRRDVIERTAGDVRLGSTTLYRLLRELGEDGYLAAARARPARYLDDERRRYFRITPAGRRALASELRRLVRVLMAAKPIVPRSR